MNAKLAGSKGKKDRGQRKQTATVGSDRRGDEESETLGNREQTQQDIDQPVVARCTRQKKALAGTSCLSEKAGAKGKGVECENQEVAALSAGEPLASTSATPASEVMMADSKNAISNVDGNVDNLPESPDYVDNLPDDVLLMVLGLLDIKTRILIERVCQRWRALARRLWKAQDKLSFTGVFSISQGKPLTVHILRAILERCGKSLRRLDLATASHMLDHKAVKAIGMRCPNLEHLDASGVQLTNSSIHQLANRCPKLKSVLLRDCCDVREKGLKRLLRRCKSLERLDLTDMYEFSGECFNVEGLQLRHLALRDCSGLTTKGICRMATMCSALTHLVLHECFKILDVDLLVLCKSLTALKVLGLSRSLLHVTSKGVGDAVAYLHHLEELDLSHNRTVSDVSMGAISTGCPKLRCLDLTNCENGITDAAMVHVAKLPGLRHLKISYVHKLTDAGISSLSCQGHLLTVEARGCTLLTDRGVLALVELCRDLLLLDLSGCVDVTSETVSGSVAIVAERSHLLTLVLGGTAAEESDVSVDGKGKLKVDLSNYCMEGYAPGEMSDMDFDYDDYWDQELYDYEVDHQLFWDSSDYEDDVDMVPWAVMLPDEFGDFLENITDDDDSDEDFAPGEEDYL